MIRASRSPELDGRHRRGKGEVRFIVEVGRVSTSAWLELEFDRALLPSAGFTGSPPPSAVDNSGVLSSSAAEPSFIMVSAVGHVLVAEMISLFMSRDIRDIEYICTLKKI